MVMRPALRDTEDNLHMGIERVHAPVREIAAGKRR